MEGKTLCVGSQVRNFHLYDLRISGTTASPISIWAHTEAVNGIEADPQRPEIFATFGRTLGEPVKLWDMKRMDSPVGEIKTSATVSAMQWSHLYPGMLSVAVGEIIQHYDTTASLSRPVLTRVNYTQSSVLDLALYPRPNITISKQPPKEPMSSERQVVTELCQNRMLVVLGDRTVRDTPKHNAAPLAISRRDGRVAHAFRGALWVRSSSDGTRLAFSVFFPLCCASYTHT
jgi:WD40 repeat protein